MPKIESGIAIPQVFLDGPVDRDLIRKCLEKAEAQSFSSAWVQETIVSPFSILEPVSLLAYAAALTDDLRLGSSVLLTTLRNPVQLAKALSSIDHLCAGRLDVGIGTGGHISESIFGYSTERRIRRF
ncbi:MAG: LLM class flavin-dependent oxidoreductase, partial [Akkermansiaceae bacterium]|nr:LLM class flavin-dependent oxidoreductase [Akkermansiaceae bacterium]